MVSHCLSEVSPANRESCRIFPADGNALVADTDYLVRILNLLYETFPNLMGATGQASGLPVPWVRTRVPSTRHHGQACGFARATRRRKLRACERISYHFSAQIWVWICVDLSEQNRRKSTVSFEDFAIEDRPKTARRSEMRKCEVNFSQALSGNASPASLYCSGNQLKNVSGIKS